MFRDIIELKEWWKDNSSEEQRIAFVETGSMVFNNSKGLMTSKQVANIPADKMGDWFFMSLLHGQNHIRLA